MRDHDRAGRLALALSIAPPTPAVSGTGMDIRVPQRIGVAVRAPPLGPLTGTRDPPGGTTPDVHTVRHQIHVRRVHTPWDPTQVVALKTGRDWTA